jgi:hypothetical protein
MSATLASAIGKPNRWRFGIRDLIWIQLLFAPAFLAPIYSRHGAGQAYLTLFAFLLAPGCFVAAVTMVGPGRNVPRPSTVMAKVCRGAFYGALFGALSLLPVIMYDMFADLRMELHLLGNLYAASVWARVWADPFGFLIHLATTFAPFVLMPLFILLHYALIGATTAGVAGIAKGWLSNNNRLWRWHPFVCKRDGEITNCRQDDSEDKP